MKTQTTKGARTMSIKPIIRRLALIGAVVALGLVAASVGQLTPAASALSRVQCLRASADLAQVDAEIGRQLQVLDHLLRGGISPDEREYVDRIERRLGELYGDQQYLQSKLFGCLRAYPGLISKQRLVHK